MNADIDRLSSPLGAYWRPRLRRHLQIYGTTQDGHLLRGTRNDPLIVNQQIERAPGPGQTGAQPASAPHDDFAVIGADAVCSVMDGDLAAVWRRPFPARSSPGSDSRSSGL